MAGKRPAKTAAPAKAGVVVADAAAKVAVPVKVAEPEKTAVSEASTQAKNVVTHLTVRALLPAGFRRAGRFWPAEDTTVAIDEFDEQQIVALSGEQHLSVAFFAKDAE